MRDLELLLRLKEELAFLNTNGYGGFFWRPYAVFENSRLCINPLRTRGRDQCQQCPLIEFVPESRRREPIPCRHLILNAMGVTPHDLSELGSNEVMEAAVRGWLEARIKELETKTAS